MLPPMIVLEPLTECMVIGAAAAWSVNILFGWDSLVFYLVHILVWFLLDWILLSVIQVSTCILKPALVDREFQTTHTRLFFEISTF